MVNGTIASSLVRDAKLKVFKLFFPDSIGSLPACLAAYMAVSARPPDRKLSGLQEQRLAAVAQEGSVRNPQALTTGSPSWGRHGAAPQEFTLFPTDACRERQLSSRCYFENAAVGTIPAAAAMRSRSISSEVSSRPTKKPPHAVDLRNQIRSAKERRRVGSRPAPMQRGIDRVFRTARVVVGRFALLPAADADWSNAGGAACTPIVPRMGQEQGRSRSRVPYVMLAALHSAVALAEGWGCRR